MKPQYAKGDFITSDGPRVPLIDRRDLVRKGMVLTHDAGGPVMTNARTREPAPSLADIRARIDAIRQAIRS